MEILCSAPFGEYFCLETRITINDYKFQLKECKFVHEVNELFLVAARYETPFNRKHRRISTILAAIFINWADNTQGSKVIEIKIENL